VTRSLWYYSNHTISDFRLGYVQDAGRSLSEGAVNHDGKFWNFFIHDDFRAAKNLSFNLGLATSITSCPPTEGM